LTWEEIDQNMYAREEVHFISKKNRLQGFIYGGSNDKGLVVISHGLGGTADAYFPMIMYLVDKGWRVFAFNNTGVSGSEGKSVQGLTQSVIDLDAALRYVKHSSTLGNLPVMLVGHSWGGYAVCAVLNYEHDVNAAVSLAAFNNGPKMFREQGVSTAGGFYYFLSPQFWAIQRLRFGSTMKLTAVDGINKAAIPAMIVHSSEDKLISAKTTSIYAHREKITNPYVEFIFFDGDDAPGHEYVFCSKERRKYIRLVNEDLQKNQVKNANLSQWAKDFGFDKIKANELNGELMERINLFFNNVR
jgi:alpha-beta hydrolase superfamily lysophospholipase